MDDPWRSDWLIGRLHIIRRGHDQPPQYGFLLWGFKRRESITLDVWFRQTLWTFTTTPHLGS